MSKTATATAIASSKLCYYSQPHFKSRSSHSFWSAFSSFSAASQSSRACPSSRPRCRYSSYARCLICSRLRVTVLFAIVAMFHPRYLRIIQLNLGAIPVLGAVIGVTSPDTDSRNSAQCSINAEDGSGRVTALPHTRFSARGTVRVRDAPSFGFHLSSPPAISSIVVHARSTVSSRSEMMSSADERNTNLVCDCEWQISSRNR